MHKFYFADKCSEDFGIYISGDNVFNAPSRDYETIVVPGRNGELLVDNGRFKNIFIAYPSFIRNKFAENANAARSWLLSQNGYKRLIDTYHPNYFRMAKFNGPLNFDTRFLNLSAECELTFNCKPQRFLISGEETVTLSQSGSLHNSELFDALPIITVYGKGKGNLKVANVTIQIKSLDDFLVIDCDMQNAYKGLQNLNNCIYAPSFPKLEHGDNEISFNGDIKKIEIKPRWWTL